MASKPKPGEGLCQELLLAANDITSRVDRMLRNGRAAASMNAAGSAKSQLAHTILEWKSAGVENLFDDVSRVGGLLYKAYVAMDQGDQNLHVLEERAPQIQDPEASQLAREAVELQREENGLCAQMYEELLRTAGIVIEALKGKRAATTEPGQALLPPPSHAEDLKSMLHLSKL